MKRITIAVLILLSVQAWSENPTRDPILPEGRDKVLVKQLNAIYDTNEKLREGLSLSPREFRQLLRASDRGFFYLAFLIRNLTNRAPYVLPREGALKTWSGEEDGIADRVDRMRNSLVIMEEYACFWLLKDLAPTPEAKELEKQAKVLSNQDRPTTERAYLDFLFSVRALFDRMKDMPKLTPQQLAEEWVASAALAKEEYEGYPYAATNGKQLDPHLYWHQHWDHEGYVLAITQFSEPNNAWGPQIVVSQRGGIFWWCTAEGPSHFLPDRYECKLPSPEFEALKKYLTSMPPTSKMGKKNHYIISFEHHGRWTTRLYDTLPATSPFDTLIERMEYQSHNPPDASSSRDELLKPLPEKPHPLPGGPLPTLTPGS